MRVFTYVAQESDQGRTDYIGVLDDGRPFWAWASGLKEEELANFVKKYAENQLTCTDGQGALVTNTVQYLRDILEAQGREDLVRLSEDFVFPVSVEVDPGKRLEKRLTLSECVEMARAKLDG